MQVHYYKNGLPQFHKTVLTIGTFDGVHVGHKKILAQLIEEANAIKGESVIITFHPHPRMVVQSNSTIQLINTIEERIGLLHQAGIRHVVVVPFTEEFSMLSAEDYIEKFLIQKFHPHTIIIGYDHRFGHGRKGDYRMLEAYSERGAFNLTEIPEHLINNNTVSATTIRNAILQGSIETANALLGYNFFFSGFVIQGDKLGRTIGYPTANLQIENDGKIIPGNGVYAVTVQVENETQVLKGMMNIGTRPTVNGTQRRIEVNIFRFDRDIYGKKLTVSIHSFLRTEKKFDGLDSLKKQLANDQHAAYKSLGI